MHRMLSIEYEEFSKKSNMGYEGMTLWGDDHEEPIESFTKDVIQDFLEVVSHIQEGDDITFSSSCSDFLSDGGILPEPILDCITEEISIAEAMNLLKPPSGLNE
jgi:hypothetical protein